MTVESVEDTEPAEPTAVPTPTSSLCVTVDSQYGVNIRGGPGVTFAQLGFAEDKAQFPLVEENPGGTWYRIRMTDGTGDETWISADFSNLEVCQN